MAKKTSTAKTNGNENKPETKAKREPSDKIVFLSSLIAKGELTKAQLVEKGVVKFPEAARSTLTTLLSDCFNAKYNRFAHIVVKDKDGKFAFKG
jgi:hypothetical protein